MSIKISDIPPEGLSLELTERLDLRDRGIEGPVSATASLTIQPADGGILRISGRVKAELMLECSRCLEPYPFPVDSGIGIELAPVGMFAAQHGEHELSAGELEMEFYEGNEVEPLEYVTEQVLISIPMVPLHDPACKGLCGICGANMNTTPCGHQQGDTADFSPFSVLKGLLKT